MTETRPPAVAWRWSAALLGVVFTVPAAIVVPFDVPSGLALGVGVLPAAILGVAPRRAARVRTVLLGALAGIPIFVGTLLSGDPVLAVVAIAVLAVGAALLTTRVPAGRVLMVLSLPMVGVGLSYTDAAEGLGLALLIVAGSAYAWLVSLAWPERQAEAAAPAPLPPVSVMLPYGVRLAAAGASAAAIGFAFDWDHVGWACAAALLVMRPSAEMQQVRSVGRIVAVAAGALAAGAMAELTTDPGWYSLAIVLVLAGASGTRGSRWYVTAGFTTFLALSMLLYANPDDVTGRINERIGETLLGVGLAYFFGLVVPAVITALRARRPAPRA